MIRTLPRSDANRSWQGRPSSSQAQLNSSHRSDSSAEDLAGQSRRDRGEARLVYRPPAASSASQAAAPPRLTGRRGRANAASAPRYWSAPRQDHGRHDHRSVIADVNRAAVVRCSCLPPVLSARTHSRRARRAAPIRSAGIAEMRLWPWRTDAASGDSYEPVPAVDDDCPGSADGNSGGVRLDRQAGRVTTATRLVHVGPVGPDGSPGTRVSHDGYS